LGHDVAISAWWGLNGAALEWNGMTVYPGDQKWGNAVMPSFAKRHDAEIVIALMDAWVLHAEIMSKLPLAVWVPVDHDPAPPKVVEFFRKSGATPIAMSRFGEQKLKDAGLDPLYVPHGIDTNIYEPSGRDGMREQADLTDKFVVGIVANNSGGNGNRGTIPRKAFPQAIAAFSALHHQHPDTTILHLHTELTGRPGVEDGINIAALLERFEVPDTAIRISNPVEMEVGISQATMAALFSSFDVLLSPSFGEGFGIPIIEAQACGTPVIVSDWTAMPELCGSGWKVGGEPWYDPQHDAFFLNPSVPHIIQALEEAYAARDDQQVRDEARQFALAYDADRVTEEFWVPVLETLNRPREVPPLNRAMRRAAAKKVAA
jgi:glycosyltransferase involved in cell wall biosynthesis